uniref:Uncharacterized protein isoform X2 n=1 Tax=Pogona vitticeps TaxID=103695 RepID=A0ABM5FGJ1_9SAUR
MAQHSVPSPLQLKLVSFEEVSWNSGHCWIHGVMEDKLEECNVPGTWWPLKKWLSILRRKSGLFWIQTRRPCTQKLEENFANAASLEMEKVEQQRKKNEGKENGGKKTLISEYAGLHEIQKLICFQCGKSFILNIHRAVHQGTHSVGNPCKCSECGNNILEKIDLTPHQITQAAQKLCKRSECGKSFVGSADSTYGPGTRTGEKPYECSDCGKSS